MTEPIKIFWIDLFCGAGGTSTGIHLAGESDGIETKVVACVNHDENAILSHSYNHPDCVHFTEDIRDFEVVKKLKKLVNELRSKHPNCLINIWASLECTNFSKAKGGMSRDADSRTLANHIFMYIEELEPDYLWIENVIEFMSWGPMRVKEDKNKSVKDLYSSLKMVYDKKTGEEVYHLLPISKKRGLDYLAWIDKIRDYGYKFDWKELNSADFGAYTARSRYFAQFPKKRLPVAWPVKTHTKNPSEDKDLFNNPLKKYKAVREVLNLDNEGKSIFDRKKPLVENTLKRIYAGLVKFVAKGDDSFLKKYYSGRPEGKVISVDGPAGTVKTADGHAYVKCNFLQRYYSGNDSNRNHSLDEPAGTVRTNNCMALVNADFLQSYYGNGNAHSADEPCPTVSTKDRFAKIAPQFLVNSYNGGGRISDLKNPAPTVTNVPKSNLTSCKFIEQQYGNSKPKSIEEPLNTITINPKFGYVTAEHFLFNPQFKNPGNSVEVPAPTVVARQDKKPLGLIACEHGQGFVIAIYEGDSDTMIKIKQFMAYFGIIDIKMRMLEVDELLRIQGFPEGYVLVGNQTEQKKYIGNSVEVKTAKAIVKATCTALVEHFKVAA